MKRNKMIETKLKGKQSEDAKWRRKEIGNNARKNKRRMTQCSQIQLINTKSIGAAPNPGQKRYAILNKKKSHNKPREAQRARNKIYQCMGVQ